MEWERVVGCNFEDLEETNGKADYDLFLNLLMSGVRLTSIAPGYTQGCPKGLASQNRTRIFTVGEAVRSTCGKPDDG